MRLRLIHRSVVLPMPDPIRFPHDSLLTLTSDFSQRRKELRRGVEVFRIRVGRHLI